MFSYVDSMLVTFIIVSDVADHYNFWQPGITNG